MVALFGGKLHADKLEEKIKAFIDNAASPVLKKELLIIQIGQNEASSKYVSIKRELCSKLGINCRYALINDLKSDDEIASFVNTLVTDPTVGGVIIQLPLPREGLQKVLDLIPNNKDVDLLSSSGKRGKGRVLSPVVRAVKTFVDEIYKGKNPNKVSVVGNGFLVGGPVSRYFREKGANVEVIESYNEGDVIDADLVVLCAGKANLVDGSCISEGANIIDFGTSYIDGKVVGDLNMNSKIDHLGVISPSKGGMGPLVVRFLIMNFLGI
jgi:methylenetetrahydrofolate dehydrogenase (NADP+)/methenyltetrahydrofolate cyclohydrolase